MGYKKKQNSPLLNSKIIRLDLLLVSIWPNTECGTLWLLVFLYLCSLGAILLDLEQNSLPGIAHLVVETLIISDQIRAEDRPSVLRALLLKHRSVPQANAHFNM